MEKSNLVVPVSEVGSIIQEVHGIIQDVRRCIQEVQLLYSRSVQ